MIDRDGPPTPELNPGLLGPLEDAQPNPSAAFVLFPGDSRYIDRKQLERRRTLLRTLREPIGKFCPGERLLYLAPAREQTGLREHLALGSLAGSYHRVALALTDGRLLEILLDVRGERPAARVRSFPWSAVRVVRLHRRRLTLATVDGREHHWVVSLTGDRKLLACLAPRIGEQLLRGDDAPGGEIPVAHCPRCAGPLASISGPCPNCRLLLRSPRLALLLSIAFPGAGLMYVGHPVLATLDLAGEALLFLCIALALLTAEGPARTLTVVPAALLLLGLVKAQSVQACRVLLRRRPSDTPSRRRAFARAGVAGALLSVVALAGPALATGALAPPGIERDLLFAVGDPDWMGTRQAAEWQLFQDDPDMRSQWIHRDGWVVSVFAYHLGPEDELETFHAAFRREEESQGLEVLFDDRDIPGEFDGFRFASALNRDDEGPYALVYYFVYDPVGQDVHQLLTIVDARMADAGDRILRSFLEESTWITADVGDIPL